MGMNLGYNHITTDKAKIEQLIKDMQIFAENTGRVFKQGTIKGYYETDRPDYFWESKTTPKGAHTTYERYFAIEIKSGSKKNNPYLYGFGWMKQGNKWIAHGWHKLWPNNESTEKRTANMVIEIVSIMEYIKKYYFPKFRITDEFDFYADFNEIPKDTIKYWKEMEQGKHEFMRKKDGTFPQDIISKEKAKKMHDISAIFKNMKQMNQTTAFIHSKLIKSGFKEENINPKSFKWPTTPAADTSTTYVTIGNQMVMELHNKINKTKIRIRRPRQITLMKEKKPIQKILLRRKDGVTQHYYKQIGNKK